MFSCGLSTSDGFFLCVCIFFNVKVLVKSFVLNIFFYIWLLGFFIVSSSMVTLFK